jgi:plastocyanin
MAGDEVARMRWGTASNPRRCRAVLLCTPLLAGIAFSSASAIAADQPVSARSTNRFVPPTVTINQGDTVTWHNDGGFHNVFFPDDGFLEPRPPADLSTPWTVTRTFGTPGTFKYYCQVHSIAMSGTVVVNAAAAPPPGVTPDATPGATAPASGPGSTPSAPGAPSVPAGTAPTAETRKGPCRSRRKFRISLREPAGVDIKSARVVVNGRRVTAVKRSVAGRSRQTADVDLRGLPRGVYRVRVSALTTTGKVLRGIRTYRTCAKERVPDRPPKL